MSNQNNKQRRSLHAASEADVYEFAPLDRETIERYAAAEERFLAANPDITQHEGDETNMMDQGRGPYGFPLIRSDEFDAAFSINDLIIGRAHFVEDDEGK